MNNGNQNNDRYASAQDDESAPLMSRPQPQPLRAPRTRQAVAARTAQDEEDDNTVLIVSMVAGSIVTLFLIILLVVLVVKWNIISEEAQVVNQQ